MKFLKRAMLENDKKKSVRRDVNTVEGKFYLQLTYFSYNSGVYVQKNAVVS